MSVARRCTFAEWLALVDAELVRLCGLDSGCLPDWEYWQAYSEGVAPKVAAERALRAAKEY